MITRQADSDGDPRDRRFRLIYPHAVIALRRAPQPDDFPLIVDHQESDSEEAAPPAADETELSGHSHDFIELVYVRAGSGLHWHSGNRHSIYAGDCYVIMPGEQHTYRSTSALSITNILFYPELLAPWRGELESLPGFRRFFTTEPLFREESSLRHKLHLSLTSQAMVSGMIKTIETELRGRADGYRVAAGSVFLQLVVILSRAFDRMLENGGMQQAARGRDSLVSAAIAFLEQNFASDLSVDDIAKSVFISPSRLSHVFKESTGMSLFDYLTRIRIDRACSLLAQSDQSVTSIAFSLGFHDSAYFTRLFSRTTGMSPSAWRRQAVSSKNTAQE